MNIRDLATKVTALAHKEAGTTVYLTGPDGIRREYDDCIFLSGRTTVIPDSGEDMVVFKPVATFPRGSLERIPKDGEKWALEAPLDPSEPNVLTVMSIDPSKAIEGGRSLGVIRFYLSEIRQI